MSSNEEFYSYFKDPNELNYLIYPRDEVEEIFKDTRSHFVKKRQDKNVKIKALYTRKEGDLPQVADSDRIRIDESKYPIRCDIAVYGENVRISTLGSSVSAILIKSKDFATTIKSLINLVFDLKRGK